MSTPRKARDPRNGLRMSATLATVFTILGHTVFGFEQSWAQVVVALVTGYTCALFFELSKVEVSSSCIARVLPRWFTSSNDSPSP